ncbi:MAG TPA: serine hydrolase [Roseateles sp.]|nr:serine hydrolase [Roseateles sp.]
MKKPLALLLVHVLCAFAAMPLRAAPDLEALPGATSLLMLRADGGTLVEAYARGAGADTLHDTRSSTKSLTALLVAAAVQDGLLQWDSPVFEAFAAEAPFAHDGPDKRGITVADLLTMSSALDCDDWQDASPGNEENMYPRRHWLRWTLDLPTRAYQRDASGRGPFAYCTAGVFLLGQLLERKAPGGLEAYQQRRLFAPLGITQWQWKRSDSGEPLTGGGLRLRTRDLAKLARLILQEGRWEGQVLLEPALLRRTLSVQRQTGMGLGYGQLFWQRDFASACGVQRGWMMSGNGGNIVAVFAQPQLAVVLTRTHYNQRQMHQQSWAFIEQQLERALCAR